MSFNNFNLYSFSDTLLEFENAFRVEQESIAISNEIAPTSLAIQGLEKFLELNAISIRCQSSNRSLIENLVSKIFATSRYNEQQTAFLLRNIRFSLQSVQWLNDELAKVKYGSRDDGSLFDFYHKMQHCLRNQLPDFEVFTFSYELPSSFGILTHLQNIRLFSGHGQSITYIPREIGNLTQLRKLSIHTSTELNNYF